MMSENRRAALVLGLSVLVSLPFLSSCIKDPTLPVLNTEEAVEVTINSAEISGIITDDGGAEITARGFCWSNVSAPSITDDKILAGTGTGKFSGTIEGLVPNTKYYVRAFAENKVGIAYGNEVTFLTGMAPPVVTTAQVSDIGAQTATCGGTVTYDGGAAIKARGICWSKEPMPDITDPHTTETPGSGNFTSTMSNLDQATVYYVRAYASNESWTVYGEQLTFRTKLADIEGNLYNTVLIGTKLWMADNLRTSKLNDNSQIQNITDNALWAAATNSAYCWYNNNSSFKPTYGALYNWFTVTSGKLCPAGWHVPTDAEFNTLEITLGMSSDLTEAWGWRGTDHGNKMKSQNGWGENGNGTNSSGFSALPGGYRSGSEGKFLLETTITYWWCSTEHDADRGWYRRLDSASDQVYRASTTKKGGKYIRCVKD